jgi:nucleoside-diphosphate-sugar epimerase
MQNTTNGDGCNIQAEPFLLSPDDQILITGACGFIGTRLVKNLLDMGFGNLRCLTRSAGKASRLEVLRTHLEDSRIEVVTGNLLSWDDCIAVTKNVKLIFHLAAGRGEKSFPDAYMNSVVTTRNLLEASARHGCLKRFVNVSSFSVYSGGARSQGRLLDELCPLEDRPELCGDAYSFAKIKQDEMVSECCGRLGISHVTVRPGYVFGPGSPSISGRVGIDTFGIFLHLGGSNKVPFTYVDNCAEAMALAGLKLGVEGEVFNIVDDDLPTSRCFLSLYKRKVRRFKSIYLPHFISYAACYLWERYSAWSGGQLAPVFNRRLWQCYWKKTHYSNSKLKTRLGWTPRVPMAEGLNRYFEDCRST